VWEPDTLALTTEAASRGDVITAGTFFGDMLPALDGAAGAGSLVWAFEPNPVNFACASWTVRMNALTNVRLRHAAVGQAQGEGVVNLWDSTGRPAGGGSYLADADPIRDRPSFPSKAHLRYSARAVRRFAFSLTRTTTAPCEIVALDEVVPPDRRVSMVQLDVEGYEEPALRGAIRILEAWRPAIILETVPTRSAIMQDLVVLGYRERGRCEANTLFTSDAATPHD
jgi:FkbM family methyltransferase